MPEAGGTRNKELLEGLALEEVLYLSARRALRTDPDMLFVPGEDYLCLAILVTRYLESKWQLQGGPWYARPNGSSSGPAL